MESPVIRKKRGISPIWILPLVALAIGGWLIYTSYRDAGISITIHYDNAKGITPGKTQVMYKGIAVGTVEAIQVDEDLQGVNLFVEMDKKTKKALVEDTKFWIVKPEISAGRISGLETILTGSYIAVQPGNSNVRCSKFKGLPEAPVLPPDSPGLHISVSANALNSLQKGSPIYTKNVQIGKVKDYHINEDGSILIDMYIQPEFSHLIRTGTRFWNSSGITLAGNLQAGFNLKVESLASLVYGGISCGTPEPLAKTSPPAKNGMIFQLYRNFDAAEYGLYMTLQLASGVGIVEGKTKVLYRGLEAGVVKHIKINNDEHHTVTAEILLDPRANPILKQGTRFWVVRPEISIDGVKNIETLIGGPYISFQPGEGNYQDNFVVEEGNMPKPLLRSGKYYSLTSPDSGLLSAGAPILYKNIVVGEIANIDFGPDAKAIHTNILIYSEYTSLVRKNSVFWNVSGIEVDASLSHFNMNLSSLKSMLAGGIAFKNLDDKTKENTQTAPEGYSFTLFESYAGAVKNVPGLKPRGIILQLVSSADNAFDVGSPVLYKKIPIGEVLEFDLSENNRNIVFKVLIYEKYTNLINTTTRFYNYSGIKIDADLTGIEVEAGPIATIVSGGISFMTPGKGGPIHDDLSFKLYQDYDAAYHLDSMAITIRMDQADGVREKTKIRYQGIEIGTVIKIRFAPDMQTIIADGRINKEAASLFREGTMLWLVKPEFGLSGIRHMETMLTGPYIDVMPGEGGSRTDFILRTDIPPAESFAGLNILLETPRLGFLSRNSPVYYRQVQVGKVTGFSLSPTAQQVWVQVNINPAYADLVHSGTRFWLARGIKASWGLFSGFDLDTETLEAILSGGIAMATPEGDEMGSPAINGNHFTLHEKSEKTWLDWNPVIMLNEGAKKTGYTEQAEKHSAMNTKNINSER